MLGLLGGLGSAAMFALASLPVGYLVDRTNRVRLLAILLGVWSFLTALSGFASSYAALFFARMGVGAAEAGGSPTIMSLIADLFPAHRRSSAIGVCYMSTAAGVSLSFLVGSAVAAAYGWRSAFWIAGVPGIILTVLVLKLLHEPNRGARDTISDPALADEQMPSFRHTLQLIVRTPAVMHIAIAITLAGFVTATLWIWSTSLLIRYHGLDLAHAGRFVAFAALFQASGSWAGGAIADRMARRETAAPAMVAGICVLLAVPFGIGLALTDSTVAALICLCTMAFLNGAWMGPSFAFVVTVVPPRMRGLVSAFVQLLVNLIGSGAGPLVAGALSDRLSGGLQSALAVCFCFHLWGAVHFGLACRAVRATGARRGEGETSPYEARFSGD